MPELPSVKLEPFGFGDLRKVLCVKCNRKGLHYAMSPHVYGWKDYTRIECRFCHVTFKEQKAQINGFWECIGWKEEAHER